MYENAEYDEIDLREILHIIRKHIISIILVPIFFAVIGGLLSFFVISPVYESSTTIIIRQNKGANEQINKTDVDLGKSLIYTYAEMAKSYTVLDNTKKSLNLEELDEKKISVSPVKDTQILKVSVQDKNPQLATDIANTLVDEFTHEVVRITKTDNVAVVDSARLPEDPIKPNKLLNIIISAILGGMLVIILVFLREYLDNTIKSERDIEKYLGVSVIGTIPNFNQGSKHTYGKIYGNKKSDITNS